MFQQLMLARFIEPTSKLDSLRGLVRQYFPSDLRAHRPDDLAAVAAELNARPRRTLGWDTPPPGSGYEPWPPPRAQLPQ